MKKFVGLLALALFTFAIFGWPPFSGGPDGKAATNTNYNETETGITRNTEFGAEMRSMFWLGHAAKRDGNDEIASIEGILGNTYLARKLLISDDAARDLMIHCIEEKGDSIRLFA